MLNGCKLTIYIAIISFLVVSCVQEIHQRSVVFQVDMNKETDSIYAVGIRGGFPPLDWDSTILMEDLDSDGIYTKRLTIQAPYKYVDFKFLKNDDVFELDGLDNRKHYFHEKDSSTYKAVFNEAE